MEVVKIKPALYRIEGQPWAWVYLRELAYEVLSMNPRDIWEHFFLLSKDIDVLGISNGSAFWNIGESGEIAHSYDGEEWQYVFGNKESFDINLDFGFFFVPAGWALDVIKAIESGVTRVEIVYHEHLDDLDECPEGTLRCVFVGPLHAATVGLDNEDNPIKTNYGQAPRHEPGCCDECWFLYKVQPGHHLCSLPSTEAIVAVDAGKAFRQLYNRRGWQVVWR
jgi:hypothetical protein